MANTRLMENAITVVYPTRDKGMDHGLVVFTERKSHIGFQLVQKLVTFSDLEPCTGRYYTEFTTIVNIIIINFVTYVCLSAA